MSIERAVRAANDITPLSDVVSTSKPSGHAREDCSLTCAFCLSYNSFTLHPYLGVLEEEIQANITAEHRSRTCTYFNQADDTQKIPRHIATAWPDCKRSDRSDGKDMCAAIHRQCPHDVSNCPSVYYLGSL
jgi:hypothetical protein